MSTNSDKKVLVCTNFRANPNQPSCAARNSKALLLVLSEQLIDTPISVIESPCMGLCPIGPNIRLAPNGPYFNGVNTQALDTIVAQIKSFTKGS